MRLVFLAGRLSQRASGVRQAVEGLSGALTRLGVDLHVVGLRDAAWDAGDDKLWTGAPAYTAEVQGPSTLGYAPGLRAIVRDLNPDVIHLHGIWMYSSAVAANWARCQGNQLVISPHGMLAPRALSFSSGRKRLIRVLYQNRCFAASSAFHATSLAEADDTRSYLGNVHVSVVPNGVYDTEMELPKWSTRSRQVVALGRLHPVKGYDLLLRSWAQIEARFPEWQLKIAGPDPDGYGDTLRQLAKELGLVRATVNPPQYGEDRDAFLANARLFALPSLTENFALTVPEALICATPVIASTGTPWEDLPDNGCGWWVAPEIDSLTLALVDALEQPDGRLEAMGTLGRSWALKSFGWDKIAANMVEFYADVVERKGKSRD
ncbi:MAG: glycosyltransferase [Rhodobacteraceae bacterium]|nr:glycosyltransferase [Paracoccaceae bacterium]